MPLLPDLISNTLKNIQGCHNTVKVFLSRTLAIVCKSEINFTKILSKDGNKLQECMNDIDSPDINPSLRVAYMEIALALVTHPSGVNWILETGIWKKILGLKAPGTVFITRLMYKFASDFLWTLNDLEDEANINLVIEFLWKPVLELDPLNAICYTIDMTNQDEICNTIEPCIQMLLSVITIKERLLKPNIILKVLLDDHCLLTKLYMLVDKMRKDETQLLIMKLIFFVLLLRVFQVKPIIPNVTYTIEDFMDAKVFFFNNLQNILRRRNVTLALDCCFMCNQVWVTVFPVEKQESLQDIIKPELHNQILVLCLVPLVLYIHFDKGNQVVPDERINEFLYLLLNNLCEQTSRIGYALRDLILETGTLPDVVIQTVKKLTSLKGLLNGLQANLLFQALFYVLRNYDPTYEKKPCLALDINFEDSLVVVVMTYVMETVLALVKMYNINWQESLEVLSLNAVVHNILTKRSNLSCKVSIMLQFFALLY
jgi:hypothetical protein